METKLDTDEFYGEYAKAGLVVRLVKQNSLWLSLVHSPKPEAWMPRSFT